jgi:glyoxylase-like metal-dependent hydrolase (beta-lactamase superfamily II)
VALEYAGRHKGIVELGIAASSRGYAAELLKRFDSSGGIAHILLSHRDDVAYAEKYARQFGTRVWIHREENRLAAPCATDLPNDGSAPRVAAGVCALLIPGHTGASVVYLLKDRVLFSGDSLAWTPREHELFAFREACW